jgi:hypothetical protein
MMGGMSCFLETPILSDLGGAAWPMVFAGITSVREEDGTQRFSSSRSPRLPRSSRIWRSLSSRCHCSWCTSGG